MKTQAMQQIFDKLRAAPRIMLFRHIRMDGDCVGATRGLKALIQATWPDKQVYLWDGQHSDYLSFLGEDDWPVPEELYAGALGVVIDTGSADRISNPLWQRCAEIIKIDHHIEREPYGDIRWVEDWRSSSCEMIAAFYEAFREELVITREAATFIYTGMVTDSGRFQYEGVRGDTLRLAGLMLDQGVDTERLYAHLYLRDFQTLKFKSAVYEQMQLTEHGVASIRVTREMQERFHLSLEEASSCVSFLDGIKGCLCWIAFIDTGDEAQSIRVRLRSRFAAINTVAEHFRGGGHACASGATVYNQAEVDALLREADEVIREYKETHEGWL